MRGEVELKKELHRIDGRGYKAYKDLRGSWDYGWWTLRIDHVQGDPYAAPTRVTALLAPEVVGFDASAYRNPSRRRGTASALARAFAHLGRTTARSRGTGKSGLIRMEHPGQVVLDQTAVRVSEGGGVEARFTVGLPARGRRIRGDAAIELLTGDVPGVVEGALLSRAFDGAELARAADVNEDADALRAEVERRGLVAFVADGASLPRRSGVDDRPLQGDEVVPFRAPDSLRVEVDLPNAGAVTGLGVPAGVTLVVGGGYHGKSTLLRAIQDGVYNHRPGDGRERVVSAADAVKIRAEDGRGVAGVDISPFIDGLPFDRDTRAFSTENASGSTSQAAAIVEALEAGAGALLVDEDTSATNFMIRDRRMQTLVPAEGEPITPFIDRVRELHDEMGVSTILVLGGSGDYLDVADTVIRMAGYRPHDVTGEARDVAGRLPTGREKESGRALDAPRSRRPAPESLDASRGRRSRNVKVPDDRTVVFGTETIDTVALEQLVHRAQSRSIGQALAWVAEELHGESLTVAELLDRVERAIDEGGLDAVAQYRVGDLMAFRRFELAATLNRLRTLRVE